MNLSRSDSVRLNTTGTMDEEEEVDCSLCKETLIPENFYHEPFG